MAAEYLLDTTVLSAFALVQCLDLLEHRFAGQVGWAEAVHREIVAGITENPSLSAILTAPWLPPPIACYALHDVARVRRRLGPVREPFAHLGEAETIIVARQTSATIATDDRDARAIAETERVPVVTTPMILRSLARDGRLTAEDAADVLDAMLAAGRRLPRLPPVWFH